MKSMRLGGRLRSGLAVLGLVTLMASGAGCDQAEGAADPLDGARLSASGENLDRALPAGPFATLTVERIDACVKLSPEQRTAIQSALDRARAAGKERLSRPGRARWGRRADSERPRFGPAAGDPPALVFLENASKTLSSDQFARLARLLGEERDRWLASRPGHGSPAAGGHRGRAGRMGGRHGMGMARGSRAEVGDGFRSKRVGKQIDARMDRLEDQLDRRGEFLDRVLDLEPAQAAAVNNLLRQTIPARKEALSGVRAGTTAPEDAAMRLLELERATAAQIGSLLTPEQRVRWEAVKDLLPRGGPGRGL